MYSPPASPHVTKISGTAFTETTSGALPYADVLVFELTRGRAKGVFLLLFNYFDVRVANDRLVVFFDDEDRVLYYGYRNDARALE